MTQLSLPRKIFPSLILYSLIGIDGFAEISDGFQKFMIEKGGKKFIKFSFGFDAWFKDISKYKYGHIFRARAGIVWIKILIDFIKKLHGRLSLFFLFGLVHLHEHFTWYVSGLFFMFYKLQLELVHTRLFFYGIYKIKYDKCLG